MRLTKEEFIKYGKTLQDRIEEERKICEALDICEWWGATILNDMYNLFTDLCDLPTNDAYGNDVDYFVWEQDFGKEGNWVEDGITIDSWEKLWNLIESTKENTDGE